LKTDQHVYMLNLMIDLFIATIKLWVADSTEAAPRNKNIATVIRWCHGLCLSVFIHCVQK